MFYTKIVLLSFLNVIILSAVNCGGRSGEHVHIKIHVPKIMKKHTHVRTIYRHHFYPKKASPKSSTYYEIDPKYLAPYKKYQDKKTSKKEEMKKTMKGFNKKPMRYTTYEVIEDSESHPVFSYPQPYPASQLHTRVYNPIGHFSDHLDPPTSGTAPIPVYSPAPSHYHNWPIAPPASLQHYSTLPKTVTIDTN